MTLVFRWDGWDVGYAYAGTQFTCPVCDRDGRVLQSLIAGGLRFVACPGCWKRWLP